MKVTMIALSASLACTLAGFAAVASAQEATDQGAPEPAPDQVVDPTPAAPAQQPAAEGEAPEAEPAEGAPAEEAPAEPEAPDLAEQQPAASAAPVEPVVGAAPPAAADAEPAVPVGGPLDPNVEAVELDARIAALDAYLEDLQPRSRAQFGAWIGMYTLLAGGQAIQAAYADDAGTRASYIVGSSLSGVGLTLVLYSPTPGRYGHRRFSRLPGDTMEEKRHKVRLGEEYLEGEAASVERTKSWFTHTLGAIFGVGSFLGLYLGYEDNLDNALRTGIGTIISTELRVWTRPYRAIRYLDEYRAAPTKVPTVETLAIAPMFAPHAQGIVVGGMF